MPTINNIYNGLKPVNYGYTRLKRIFTSDVNFTTYNKIVSTAKNKTLGNLPTDILQTAIKTENKEAVIKTIQNGFAKAAEKLKEIHTLRSKSVSKYIPDKEDIKKTYEMILDGEWDCYDYLKNRLKNKIVPKEISAQIEEKASKLLKESMADILPANTAVCFKPLGEGNFAKAYKIEFRDANNQKVFNDCTMKLYKDKEEDIIINSTIQNKIKETLFSLTDDEIKELYKRLPFSKKATPEIWERVLGEFKKTYKPKSECELAQSINIKKAVMDCVSKMNGMFAEANSYRFIEKAAGHPLDNTNLNKHYMFDMQNNFNLSAFSDRTRPPANKRLNFTNIGLVPIDPYDNYENIVYGRIIDLGGIVKLNNDLMDKTVLKYFKKIVNRNTEKERQRVIQELKKLISNPKTPLRNKIEKAIGLAENIKTCNKC